MFGYKLIKEKKETKTINLTDFVQEGVRGYFEHTYPIFEEIAKRISNLERDNIVLHGLLSDAEEEIEGLQLELYDLLYKKR